MTPPAPPRRPVPAPGSWQAPLSALLVATPVLALVHLALLALIAALRSGLWPLTPRIDPKDASLPGHDVLVVLFVIAAMVSPLPWAVLTFASPARTRWSSRVRDALLFVAAYALFWIVVRTDPWGVLTWLFD